MIHSKQDVLWASVACCIETRMIREREDVFQAAYFAQNDFGAILFKADVVSFTVWAISVISK